MIEVAEDGYYLGLWYLPGHNSDWLACISRKGDDWDLVYRFRYYAPNETFDPFDGNDQKSWYRATLPMEKCSEEKAIEAVSTMQAGLVAMGFMPEGGEPFAAIIRGDGKAFRDVLVTAPFAHLRMETDEE